LRTSRWLFRGAWPRRRRRELHALEVCDEQRERAVDDRGGIALG
jgi:hypothetical protein